MSLKKFELFRLMPSSKITLETVSSGGGTLKTGAYQVAYRLIDDYSGRSTKFSLFSFPIVISNTDTNGDKNGALSTNTDKAITVSFNSTNEEIELYNTYQIAVIESNVGSGQSSIVSLSDQFSLSPGKNIYKVDSNQFFDRIGIEETSIDDAAIKTFKTIAFKNNKLLGGNIKYKDLAFDNGVPSVQSGQIITRKIPVSGNTDKAVSESRGYFLDEVYRFYVSFWDEYGNFSFPYPLNMSNVTGNEADAFSGFKDMKFPKRDINNKIIETSNYEENEEYVVTNNRGLRLVLTNIPSWSRGYVIARAVRKKGILFQSPLIPTTIVQSPDAQGVYPGEGAQAPNPLGTIIPKNMAFSLNKAIVRKQGADFSHVDWSANYDDFEFCKKIHVGFPPEIIFNNSGVPYVDFIQKERMSIESVDYCMLSRGFNRLLSRNKSVPVDFEYINDGSRATSSLIAASASQDYASNRLDRGQYESEILATDRPITDEIGSITIVPAGVQSVPIVGLGSEAPTSEFGNHSDLRILPDGPQNGSVPSNQPMIVFTTKLDRPDISYYGVSGNKSGYTTETVIQGVTETGNPKRIISTSIIDVLGQNANPGYENDNSFIEIVNFRSSLGDDRYGDPFSKNDIVSTGSIATYLSIPETSTVEVYGGDCYISPFTFKVHDSHYAVVNSDLWGDTGVSWGKSFKDEDDKEIRRPFAYKSMGINIGVFLESEVNALYGEELTSKGRGGDFYPQITPSISAWSGVSAKGAFYSYQDKIYRGLIDDVSGVTPSSSVGYVFEDLNRSLNGTYYPIKFPIDTFYFSRSFTENRAPLLYFYGKDFSINDASKPFPLVYSKDKINRTSFSSRIVYSDTGILQTNIEGFNRFRVGNIYDLEESRGSLTKLINHKGNLYGVQSGSFCYIPFEASLIETADGISLAVQSSQIVGKPNYIESYGSNHIRTVVSTPGGLMFSDFDNSKIVRFEGSVSYLNDLGVSSYIKEFSESIRGLKISDKDAQSYYDYSVDDVVFKMGQEALILGPTGSFKTILRPPTNFGTARWDYGFYFNSGHYLIGSGGDLGEEYMLTKINDPESLQKKIFGNTFGSSITFVVNKDPYYTKMFYLIKFIASSASDVNIDIFTNGAIKNGYQGSTLADRWGGQVLGFIRNNEDKRRLRGEYAVVTTEVGQELSMALTKVQAAYRII